MSVRFFKIIVFVALAHGIVLSVLWVGFPVPNPRPAAMFIYAGSLPATETVAKSQGAILNNPGQANTFLDYEAPSFNSWIELRNPSKPSQHDYLGF